jgi:hypothetical protein
MRGNAPIQIAQKLLWWVEFEPCILRTNEIPNQGQWCFPFICCSNLGHEAITYDFMLLFHGNGVTGRTSRSMIARINVNSEQSYSQINPEVCHSMHTWSHFLQQIEDVFLVIVQSINLRLYDVIHGRTSELMWQIPVASRTGSSLVNRWPAFIQIFDCSSYMGKICFPELFLQFMSNQCIFDSYRPAKNIALRSVEIQNDGRCSFSSLSHPVTALSRLGNQSKSGKFLLWHKVLNHSDSRWFVPYFRIFHREWIQFSKKWTNETVRLPKINLWFDTKSRYHDSKWTKSMENRSWSWIFIQLHPIVSKSVCHWVQFPSEGGMSEKVWQRESESAQSDWVASARR